MAINAGLAKVRKYYKRASLTDAYIMAMGRLLAHYFTFQLQLANIPYHIVLEPSRKFAHMDDFWSKELTNEAKSKVLTIVSVFLSLVCRRFKKLNST